tara:strand:- start:129 stop:488 length:360 start_codon:yes stop_codon:yes gene_type:complete
METVLAMQHSDDLVLASNYTPLSLHHRCAEPEGPKHYCKQQYPVGAKIEFSMAPAFNPKWTLQPQSGAKRSLNHHGERTWYVSPAIHHWLLALSLMVSSMLSQSVGGGAYGYADIHWGD